MRKLTLAAVVFAVTGCVGSSTEEPSEQPTDTDEHDTQATKEEQKPARSPQDLSVKLSPSSTDTEYKWR